MGEAPEMEPEGRREPIPDAIMDRMREARTEYAFRCGFRPKRCGDLLDEMADLIRDAADGFGDE